MTTKQSIGDGIAGRQLPDMMRAASINQLGPASNIHVQQLEVPRTGADEVLVKVDSVAVNHVDTFVRSGAFATPLPFPFIVGRDLVGTVLCEAAHLGFGAGERVWCNSLGHDSRQGAAAEYAAVPASRLYHLPAGVDVDAAAAALHPGATAYLGLYRHGWLDESCTVFIGGGAGHVGAAAITMAARAGAHVITTCAAEDQEYCRSLGAQLAFDYRDEGAQAAIERAAGAGIDIYMDTSGHLDLEHATGVLAQGGRIVLMAGMHACAVLPVGSLYTKDGSIRGFAISNASIEDLAAAAEVINPLLAEGALRPRHVEVRDLAGTAEAHQRLEEGRARGVRYVVHPAHH